MKSKKNIKSTVGTIQNRTVRRDYTIGDSYLAGIVLLGWETKALRLGHGQLHGAYITIRGSELYLINATITPTKGVGQNADSSEFTRARKLLLKKREIDELHKAKTQGSTIVPIEILKNTRFIKIRIATGKGKKEYDKRQTLKKRDQEREVSRLVK